MFEMKILTPPEEAHINPITGQIKVNRFVESFKLSIFTWRPEDYMNQWETEIERLLKKKNSTAALITDLTSPRKDDYLWCWSLYRENETVYIQNNLFFMKWMKGKFDINKLAEYLGPRRTESIDGGEISEQSASIKDVEDFLKRIPKLRKPYEEFSRKQIESAYKFKP